MSRAETSRLPLMDALLQVGPEGATREDLLQRSGISTSSFYRIMKPLQEQGLVEFSNQRYRLLLTKPYNFRYKMWRDTERLMALEPRVRQQVEDVVNQAQEELGSNLLALWLIGSAAHGEMATDSDLDFLAVTDRSCQFHPTLHRPVQFVSLTRAGFRTKVRQGDSFVASALRYGLLLEDRGFASEWLDTPANIQLEAAQIAFVQETLEAHREKMFFLLRNEAHDEAVGALKAYAVTLGRAMLAFYRELPSGKPDLVRQLRLYYGRNPVEAVLDQHGDRDASVLAGWQELETYWKSFLTHRGALEFTVEYPYSNGVQFAYESQELLNHSLPLKRVELTYHGDIDDCFYLDAGERFCVEFDSTFGALRKEKLQRFISALREAHYRPENDPPGVWVVNAFNKVRLSVRDFAVTPDINDLLKQHNIHLLWSHELLQLHNQIQLTSDGTQALVSKLLGSGKPDRRGKTSAQNPRRRA